MRRMQKMISMRALPGDPELLSTAAEEVGASRSKFVRDAALERAQEVLRAAQESDPSREADDATAS